jgi:hypothetical protein
VAAVHREFAVDTVTWEVVASHTAVGAAAAEVLRSLEDSGSCSGSGDYCFHRSGLGHSTCPYQP